MLASGSDYALLLLENAVEGGNVLTKASVDTLWELNARVWALEVENMRFNLMPGKGRGMQAWPWQFGSCPVLKMPF